MIKLFLDTNVLADIFFDRMPHSNHSLTLLTLASDRSWQLSTSALTIANLLYLLRKQSKSKQQESIEIVTKYVQVLDLNLEQIKQGITLNHEDTEDGIQMAVATANNQELILTRDLKGFLNCSIPVKTVAEFLNEHLTLDQ